MDHISTKPEFLDLQDMFREGSQSIRQLLNICFAYVWLELEKYNMSNHVMLLFILTVELGELVVEGPVIIDVTDKKQTSG